MANPLDWAARAILQINGMSPEEIKQKARQVKNQKPKKPMPKANTSAPAPQKKQPVTRKTRINGRVKPGAVNRPNQAGQAKPQVNVNPGPNSSAQGRNLIKEGADRLRKPKPPARPNPGSINPKGQTNAFNAKGQPRDFRNPKVSANRPPTLSPVESRSSARPTPPKPPIGGHGRQSPGQGYLNLGAGERTGNKDPWGPGTSPRRQQAQQGTPRKAPSISKPGTATKTKPSAPAAAPKPKVSAGDAAAARAVKAVNASKVLNVGRLGGVATGLGIANAIDDSRLNAAQKAKKYEVVDPARKDRVVNNLLNGGPKAKDAPKPKPNPKSQAKAPSAAQQATDKRDKKKLF